MISPCGNYVATSTNSELSIHELINKTVYRQYTVSGVVSVAWESTAGDACVKIAVVLADSVHVYDFSQPDPIVIQSAEGVERVEWIPVAQDMADGASAATSGAQLKAETDSESFATTGYTNAKQLVVFTPLALYARVYSLDCTHILFTVVKPVGGIIVRPDSSQWSLAVEPVEYNAQPVVYTFLNSGSYSTLIHTTPYSGGEVSWSPSGKWLSSFTGSLSGYELHLFGLIGPEILRVRQDEADPHTSWMQIDNEDIFLVVSSGVCLAVSTNMLRINRQALVLPTTGYNFSRGEYRKTRNIASTNVLHAVHTNSTTVVLQYDHSIVVYKLENYLLLPKCYINCQARSVKLYDTRHGHDVMIMCRDHVVIYSSEEDALRVVYQSQRSILAAYVIIDEQEKEEDDEIHLVIQREGGQIDSWTRVTLAEVSALGKIIKRNHESTLAKNMTKWDTSVEVTDTFVKKRPKLNL